MLSCAIAILLFVALIYMGVAGFSAISKNELPEKMIRTVFGKGNYATDPATARTIGTVMLLPPISFVLALIMNASGSEKIGLFFSNLTYLLLFGIFIVIAIWSRRWNKTKPQENESQADKSDSEQN